MAETDPYVEIGPLETSEDVAVNLAQKKEDEDDDERAMWDMDPPPRPTFPFVLIISLGFLLSILLMMTALGLSLSKSETISTPLVVKNEFCVTPKCMGVAIRSAMDLLTDPCTHFYKYACGGWNANDREGFMATAYMPRLSFVEAENREIILKILEEKPPILQNSSALWKAQLFYQSCLDPVDDEVKRVDRLKDLLSKVGGWSISPSNFSLPNNFDFQKLLQNLHANFFRSSSGPFFTTFVSADPESPETNVIHLAANIDEDYIFDPLRHQQQGHDVDLDMMTGSSKFDLNVESMTKIAVTLGAENNEKTQEMIQSVINFAQNIKNLTHLHSLENLEAKNYEKMNMTSLTKICGVVNWRDYFSNILANEVNTTQPDDLVIVVHRPNSFFRPLCQLIEDKLTGSKRDEGRIELNNYMVWQLVTVMFPFVFDDHFSKVASGRERKQFCSKLTTMVMPVAVGSAYVAERGGQLQKDKMAIEGMLKNIQTEFLDHLNSLGWLQSDQEWAGGKLKAMNFLVGYPEFLGDMKKIDAFYDGLVIGKRDFWGNAVKMTAFNRIKMWQRRDDQPVKNLWPAFKQITSNEVHYISYNNQAFIPAGILQPPIFRSDFPAVFNFGTLGLILGRQLTLAVTNNGRHYDKDGRFGHWWSNETVQKFNETINCLKNEPYLESDTTLQDERSTLGVGEIIGDLGGLKFAYLAYKKLAQELELEAKPHFPHLDQLDHDQLFFVSFAQLLCSGPEKNAKLAGKTQKLSEHVSSNQNRIEETLKNFPEFSQAFQCPLNSPMNPEKKCGVW